MLLLRAAEFERFLDAHPRAARALLRVLGRRLRRDTTLLYEAVFFDLPQRLGQALLRLAATQQVSARAGESPAVRTTQEELASMLGATRESVNKWLGFYERRGVLRRGRGLLTILRPEVLRRQRP